MTVSSEPRHRPEEARLRGFPDAAVLDEASRLSDTIPNPEPLGPDARGFAREGTIYILAVTAPVLSALLITPLVTRSLGAQQYGHVALGIATYQIVSVLVALGLPAAITRNALIESSGSRGSAGTVVIGTVAATATALVAILSLGLWGDMVFPSADTGVITPALACAAALATQAMCQAQLRALSKARTFAAVGIVGAVLPPAMGLAAVAWGTATGTMYVSAVAVGQALVAIAALGIVVSHDRPTFSWKDARRSLQISLPTVPHQLAAGGIGGLLVIAAGRTLGTVAAGQLQLSLLIGMAPMIIIGALNNAWAPRVYRLDSRHRARFISDTTPQVASIGALLSVSAAALAPLGFAFVAPPGLATEPASRAIAVIAAGSLVSVLYLASIHLVFASGRTGLLAVTTPVSLVCALLVSALVAQRLPGAGLWAFAAAIPLFQVLQALMAAMLRRRTGTTELRLGRSILVVIAGALACLTIAFLEPELSARLTLTAALVSGAAVVLVTRHRRRAGNGPAT